MVCSENWSARMQVEWPDLYKGGITCLYNKVCTKKSDGGAQISSCKPDRSTQSGACRCLCKICVRAECVGSSSNRNSSPTTRENINTLQFSLRKTHKAVKQDGGQTVQQSLKSIKSILMRKDGGFVRFWKHEEFSKQQVPTRKDLREKKRRDGWDSECTTWWHLIMIVWRGSDSVQTCMRLKWECVNISTIHNDIQSHVMIYLRYGNEWFCLRLFVWLSIVWVWVCWYFLYHTMVIRTYIQLNVMFREGHFLTVLLENTRPLLGWCEEVNLTMPEPSCCSRPEPCDPPSADIAEGRRDRMFCMLLVSR